MYEIESGIKINIEKKEHGSKYPFNKMKVGDSFFAPNVKQAVISSAASSFKRDHKDVQLIVRTVDGGVRCWRVA